MLELANVGPYSVAIFVASILFPLFALAGLVLTLRAGTVRTIVRGCMAVTWVALLAMAVYTTSIGWLGLQTWTM